MMGGVRHWVSLAYQPFAQLVALAQAAEAAGFHGVTIAEHVATPATISSQYPYRADGVLDVSPDLIAPEPLITAAVLGAATSRLHLATTVYLLPLHELFSAAKAISTAACFLEGRLVLGVGVGWIREEYDLLGQPFASRGRRADEMLAVIGRLLRGETVSHHGECYDVEAVRIAPVPASPPPVVVGGESRAALERAARADGWVASRPHEAAELADLLAVLRAARVRVHPEASESTVMVPLEGAPEQGELAALQALGVTDVLMRPRVVFGSARASLGERLAAVEAFGKHYLR